MLNVPAGLKQVQCAPSCPTEEIAYSEIVHREIVFIVKNNTVSFPYLFCTHEGARSEISVINVRKFYFTPFKFHYDQFLLHNFVLFFVDKAGQWASLVKKATALVLKTLLISHLNNWTRVGLISEKRMASWWYPIGQSIYTDLVIKYILNGRLHCLVLSRF